MIPPATAAARAGHGQLTGDWSAKTPDDLPIQMRPFYQRRWFRLLVFGGAGAAGVLGAVVLGFISRRHDDRLADRARQYRGLETFLRSTEFAQFARMADRQFVALFNFIAVQPQSARAVLPAVAARETAQRLMPWTHEVVPLPISASAEPEQHRARRLLAPHVAQFLARSPDIGFPALDFDRGMQEAVLAGYACAYTAKAVQRINRRGRGRASGSGQIL